MADGLDQPVGLSRRSIEPLCPQLCPPGAPAVPLAELPEAPLLSIIVPSFNQGDFIQETIDSVLMQDYRPIEVIVVDGASTDCTLEILERYQGVGELCVLSESDSGVVEAVNKGFAMARGSRFKSSGSTRFS